MECDAACQTTIVDEQSFYPSKPDPRIPLDEVRPLYSLAPSYSRFSKEAPASSDLCVACKAMLSLVGTLVQQNETIPDILEEVTLLLSSLF